MKVWIFWSEKCQYGATGCEEVNGREAAQKWIDDNAEFLTHNDIDRVIEGRELHVKPVEVVKRYELTEALK
jgi:hypothetical protein